MRGMGRCHRPMPGTVGKENRYAYSTPSTFQFKPLRVSVYFNMHPLQGDEVSVNVGRLARGLPLAPKYEYVGASDLTTAVQGLDREPPTSPFIIRSLSPRRKGNGKAAFESFCFPDSGVPGARLLEGFVLLKLQTLFELKGSDSRNGRTDFLFCGHCLPLVISYMKH